MTTRTLIASLVLTALATPFIDARAQGSLTPPGAPAPTMKSLDQLEARTPITTATNITQSGSYYLVTNITVSGGDGIVIEAGEVMLDLNGFTIRSTAPSATGHGILLDGAHRDITLSNGFVAGGVTNDGAGVFNGPGFDFGIYGYSNANVRVSGISVSGCRLSGIALFRNNTVVDDCIVSAVGSSGIQAGIVRSSVAEECGLTAISGEQVADCRGGSLGNYGILADTVHNSYGYANSPVGFPFGISAAIVRGSHGEAVTDSGQATGILGSVAVEHSHGEATSSTGTAQGITGGGIVSSHGETQSQGGSTTWGIRGGSVQDSRGSAQAFGSSPMGAGFGIQAVSVSNSEGSSSRNNLFSRGIEASGPVETSYAFCRFSSAIEAESASNCRGESEDGYGIDVQRTALNCVGISSASYGVVAQNAMNCDGEGVRGISVTTATGCRGIGTTDSGVNATATALNCYGSSTSGTGLYASNAQNCYGLTITGFYGLYASNTAIGCRGVVNNGSGTGIYGHILNSCTGSSASGAAVSLNHNYNMP